MKILLLVVFCISFFALTIPSYAAQDNITITGPSNPSMYDKVSYDLDFSNYPQDDTPISVTVVSPDKLVLASKSYFPDEQPTIFKFTIFPPLYQIDEYYTIQALGPNGIGRFSFKVESNILPTSDRPSTIYLDLDKSNYLIGESLVFNLETVLQRPYDFNLVVLDQNNKIIFTKYDQTDSFGKYTGDILIDSDKFLIAGKYFLKVTYGTKMGGNTNTREFNVSMFDKQIPVNVVSEKIPTTESFQSEIITQNQEIKTSDAIDEFIPNEPETIISSNIESTNNIEATANIESINNIEATANIESINNIEATSNVYDENNFIVYLPIIFSILFVIVIIKWLKRKHTPVDTNYESLSFNELIQNGLSFQNQDKNLNALKLFDRAIAINRENEEVWVYKGQTHEKLHQYNVAIYALNIALGINFKNKSALLSLLGIYEKLGQPQDAKKCRERINRYYPQTEPSGFTEKSESPENNGIIRVSKTSDNSVNINSFQNIPESKKNVEKIIDLPNNDMDNFDKEATVLINELNNLDKKIISSPYGVLNKSFKELVNTKIKLCNAVIALYFQEINIKLANNDSSSNKLILEYALFLNDLANCYFELKDYDTAIIWNNKSIAANNNIHGLIGLMHCYSMKTSQDISDKENEALDLKSISYAHQVLQMDPTNILALQFLKEIEKFYDKKFI